MSSNSLLLPEFLVKMLEERKKLKKLIEKENEKSQEERNHNLVTLYEKREKALKVLINLSYGQYGTSS
jgi:DNA polymerase elongation subunit (family B)